MIPLGTNGEQELVRRPSAFQIHVSFSSFLNARTIALLPQGAIVVNTARGGLVVDEDLIAAFKSGHLAAAGLDVFEGEPKLNPGYVELKNVFLLPHIGTATIESRTNMGMVALDNIDAVLRPAPSLAKV
jgi:phosphoglycerate dehydrogenase-like enzyme